jgi:hypothetical protein
MKTVLVEYIGNKPEKVDNVANTGVIWLGNGDVRAVPIEAWSKMARHEFVWRLAEEQKAVASLERTAAAAAPAPAPAAASAPAPEAPKQEAAEIYGTDHPEQIEVGPAVLPLADVINAALAKSGLSTEEWNALADADRFDFVEAHIHQLRAEEAARAAGQQDKAQEAAKEEPAPSKGSKGGAAGTSRRKAKA